MAFLGQKWPFLGVRPQNGFRIGFQLEMGSKKGPFWSIFDQKMVIFGGSGPKTGFVLVFSWKRGSKMAHFWGIFDDFFQGFSVKMGCFDAKPIEKMGFSYQNGWRMIRKSQPPE